MDSNTLIVKKKKKKKKTLRTHINVEVALLKTKFERKIECIY